MKHYQEIAEDFEDKWFFDKDYFGNLCQIIYKHLDFNDGNSFLDLGCGTGNFDQALLNLAKSKSTELKLPFYGVDLSKEMLEKYNSRGENFKGTQSCISEYIASGHFKFNKILLKEVIHHINNREVFFKELGESLEEGGHALVLTRPKKLNFPFFKKALDDFADSQPSVDVFIEELGKAGANYKILQESINVSMTKDHLFKMISGKFMSFFQSYTDECIQEGLKELKESLKEDTLYFQDTFHIIKIYKN